jgi:hypothetical protein
MKDPNTTLRDIFAATRSYETWLGQHLPLDADHLARKHQKMTESAFAFLRATYYRWLELWQALCPELHDAPVILAVGDLHAENFGTWRDAEGRLIWGINDFDEAARLPYTFDLVRLAASLRLAVRQYDLSGFRFHRMCACLYSGYAQNIKIGGRRPFVLAKDNEWLTELAQFSLKDPQRFWKELLALSDATDITDEARQVLLAALPPDASAVRFVRRTAGLGSLGQPRWAALASWHGDWIARDLKALPPTAQHWFNPASAPTPSPRAELVQQAVRTPDPFQIIQTNWVVRRLAPDCSKLDLEDIQSHHDWSAIFYAMGWETANIHRNRPENAAIIQADLARRPHRWLDVAAKRLCKALRADWKTWRDGYTKQF